MRQQLRAGLVALARTGFCEASAQTGEAWIQMDGAMRAVNRVEGCVYSIWRHAYVHLDGDLSEFARNLRSEYIHMACGDLTEDLLEV